jgi:hypothetical protein
LVSISAGLVPEPAICPGAGAAGRSQETLKSFRCQARELIISVCFKSSFNFLMTCITAIYRFIAI